MSDQTRKNGRQRIWVAQTLEEKAIDRRAVWQTPGSRTNEAQAPLPLPPGEGWGEGSPSQGAQTGGFGMMVFGFARMCR